MCAPTLWAVLRRRTLTTALHKLAIALGMASVSMIGCASSQSSADVGDAGAGLAQEGGTAVVEVTSADLEPVGRLSLQKPDATAGVYCSGTLIAPSWVITAKHCLRLPEKLDGKSIRMRQLGTVRFRAGASAALRVVDREAFPVEQSGGVLGDGIDIALAHLETPIDDLLPALLGRTTPSVGSFVLSSGFGAASSAQQPGVEHHGNWQIKAVNGGRFASVYATFDAFLAAARAVNPNVTVESQRELYDAPLAEGYEAYAMPVGDSRVCKGDSGGPVFQRVSGQLAIVGVNSTTTFVGVDESCHGGSVFATLGPQVLELITRSGL